MDKLEYIQGDLVKVIIDDEEQVVKVIGYSPTYEEYSLTNEYIKETRGYICAREEKIQSIPLASVLLKKMGGRNSNVLIVVIIATDVKATQL